MQASTSVAAEALPATPVGSPASGARAVAGGTAGLKRAHYRNSRLPFFLLLPQLLVLLLFFFIPAVRALVQAFVLTDPFGTTRPLRLVRQFPRPVREPRVPLLGLGHRRGSRWRRTC